MLLKGQEFLQRIGGLGVLMDKDNGKSVEDCETCLIKELRAALSAEREVAEQFRKRGVLSEQEYQAIQRDFIQCSCQLCRDFGCRCDDTCDLWL